MGCQINKDIPDYMVAAGINPRIRSINTVGLKRRGFSALKPLRFKPTVLILLILGLMPAATI